jgi:hypothetical protein
MITIEKLRNQIVNGRGRVITQHTCVVYIAFSERKR